MVGKRTTNAVYGRWGNPLASVTMSDRKSLSLKIHASFHRRYISILLAGPAPRAPYSSKHEMAESRFLDRGTVCDKLFPKVSGIGVIRGVLRPSVDFAGCQSSWQWPVRFAIKPLRSNSQGRFQPAITTTKTLRVPKDADWLLCAIAMSITAVLQTKVII
jgi:hypothetical protein